MALLNEKLGKRREAIEQLTNMLVAYPEKSELYQARAEIELALEQNDMALLDVEQALKLSSGDAELYVFKAQIHLVMKNKTQARADLDKAVSLGINRSQLVDMYKQCK